MKTRLLAFALVPFLAVPVLTTGEAAAKGCIKGAIVGGVAGHMVGHGVAGAAAGCIYGRHRAKEKALQQQQNVQPVQPGQQYPGQQKL
ncbi:MAG: hypothetical protein KGL46_04975 [Hyphomicrobiales bacterium]|nr:hypothetical protein [Hyphomicrobiales bacterium]